MARAMIRTFKVIGITYCIKDTENLRFFFCIQNSKNIVVTANTVKVGKGASERVILSIFFKEVT